MSDETITLDAVARRLALTPEQTARARGLLGNDAGPVRAVLAACRAAQRPTDRGSRRPVHAFNAALITTLVDDWEKAA